MMKFKDRSFGRKLVMRMDPLHGINDLIKRRGNRAHLFLPCEDIERRQSSARRKKVFQESNQTAL